MCFILESFGSLLALYHALEDKELDERACGAEKDTAEHTDASVFHTADNAEKRDEANGGEDSLFNLNGCRRGKESDDGADKGDQPVAKACIYGMIIGNRLSVGSFIICVHIYTCLSDFRVYGVGFLKMELDFANLVEILFL